MLCTVMANVPTPPLHPPPSQHVVAVQWYWDNQWAGAPPAKPVLNQAHMNFWHFAPMALESHMKAMVSILDSNDKTR